MIPTPAHPGPRSLRRGAGGIAAVVTLVFAQIFVVGAVVTGTRDQDLTPLRLDTTRAFYASEAGINMAVREAMSGVDEDGDGTAGTISNDGNASNDPTLVTARFSVSMTLTNGVAQMSCAGRSGNARRKADASVSGVTATSTQTVMLGYGVNNSNQPRYRTWNGTSWSSASTLSSINAEAKWVRMKICPSRNETVMITENENQQVHARFYNGTSWGSPIQLSSDTGGTNDRPEDLAYEQNSGDALCVYWKGTSGVFAYRTYNGTSFAAEQTISSPFSTEADFVTLYPRSDTDDIVLRSADGLAGGKLAAAIWNGTSWTSWSTLVSSLESNNEEPYSLSFESNTGRGVAVYIESGQNTPRYRTLTGSTWSSQGSLPNIGSVGHWVRTAPDPTSNKILFVALDEANDINANCWSGSSWGANTELETNCAAYDRRQFDVCFERSTGKALLVYVENGQNLFRYRTWSGSAWSGELSGPSLGAQPQIIHLARGVGDSEIVIACSDSSNRLQVVRWNGSSMSSATVVESALSGQLQYYSFALPEPTVQPQPRIQAWAEVTP